MSRDKLITKKDYIFSYGFAFIDIIFTALIFLTNQYIILPTNVPFKTIIGHMLTDDSSIFLLESSNYSAPLICSSTHIWSAVFLPMLASMPYLLLFSGEMNGNYRIKIPRIGNFDKYWNRIFLKAGFWGASCVTTGYMIFSAAVFAYFPHMSEYPEEAAIGNDIFSMMAVRRPLDGTINKLFGNTESELLYWLPKAINVFMYSFLVAVLCMLLYILTMNRYKAIGVPMIVFYLAEQLSTRRLYECLNPKYQILSPRSLLINAEYTFSVFGIGGFGYLIFYSFFAILIYFAGRAIFRKRVMN